MFLSLNWLKDLVNIPNSVSPEELGTKLTNYTVEVEKIEKQAARFDNVVVGKVLEVKKHPNADRLNLTRVDVGAKEPLAIVCGAPNVSAGQLVPVAKVGAVLPNGMKIEERDVRGEKSFGMICAEDELGLGGEHAGIMVLGKKVKVGQPFAEYLKLDDVVFEVDNKSLSNRPDLWGHLGMAREIAVLLDSKTTKEFKKFLTGKIEDSESLGKLSVKVEDDKLCPRYAAVKISNVEIKESPEWMQQRLTAAGMRPINNIVDATNYVMLELGEPMHAFDAALVQDIVVRRAGKDETIKTLDGIDRILDNSMLVIADKEKAIAIAGVMGSEGSEINQSTKAIILEAANFDASSIRKTSTKLGLRTEASMRFEKALDPNICDAALARCFELITETCKEAEVDSQVADLSNFTIKTGPIEFDLNWAAKRLGEDLGKKQIIKILEALGFEVDSAGAHLLRVAIPTWRATKDISIREDVLEEIARVHGYNNFPISMPVLEMRAPLVNEERKLERKIKNILALGAGSTEVYNYSFVGEEKLSKLKLNPKGYIRLVNPIASHQTMLRQNLLENLVDNIKSNQAKYDRLSLFEVGSIFWDSVGRINKDSDQKENLPFQIKHLGLIEAGAKAAEAYDKVKGKLEYLLENFDLEARFEGSEMTPEWADKRTFAKVIVAGEEIGWVANLPRAIAASLGVKKETAALEIDLEKLTKIILSLPGKMYAKPNKYPTLERDLAFVVKENVLYNNIKAEIEKFDILITKTELFDVYQGKNLPAGQKSLAFHVTYSSPDRTLESAEVDALQEKLINHLKEKYDAQIRNF
ncbi:MAG: phenylalanine--tRNA ligase subunit beta [Patescibacteria group bacterium]|nr:phenylalanine--tRNA ligase subunit beta [Patescibacteria group bacterium]